MKKAITSIYFILIPVITYSQFLQLPPRHSDALSGSEFIEAVRSLPKDEIDKEIYCQIINGNIPDFLRKLNPIDFHMEINGNFFNVTYYVTNDYLSIGSDLDYFLTPMSPILAQKICKYLNCTLPTRKMVDQIYASSQCKLKPQPLPPSINMTSIAYFAQHNDSVKSQRIAIKSQYPLGTLVGGTKKDIIISNLIVDNLKPNVPKPVVIYGWHQQDNLPIQPIYNGHDENYADYSHGVRLVLDSIVVNGVSKTFKQIITDPVLNILISDEGTILSPFYKTDCLFNRKE